MKIQAPTVDERAAGIYAWLSIPRRSFAKALALQVPDRLQANILNAVNDAKADIVEVSVPLDNQGEANVLRYAGIGVS